MRTICCWTFAEIFKKQPFRISSHLLLRLALVYAGLALCAGITHAQTQPQAQPQKAAPAVSHTTTNRNRTVAPRSNVDMLEAIERSGKLRVGISEIIPLAMHDKGGNFIGFEVDVARKLARDMGVKVEFHPTPLAFLIPDLLAGRTDIIIADLSIKADRALLVNFSNPYNSTPVTLATNTKLSSQLSTLDALNKSEITIGALAGSTAEEMISVTIPNARIRTYDWDSQLFQDLVAGKLDAAVADSPRPEIVAKLFPSSVVFPSLPPLITLPAAFAVRRGDMDFVNFLNSWIAARTDNRWLDERRTYWFKTMDWEKDL
jgi:polar amino acid transport system substrate-binding protein